MGQVLRSLIPAAALAAGLGGCGRSVQSGPLTTGVSPDAYEGVLEAAVDVLRDRRFVIDRQDRRFGVVTTRPRSASTWMDYQTADHGHGDSRNHATLNHHRRHVRVALRPRDDDGEGPPDHYELVVKVFLEQRQLPATLLNTAAMTSLRPLAAGRGGGGAFWRPLGRDKELEETLLRAISDRAGLSAGVGDGS